MHNTPSVKLPNGQVFRAKHHVNCKTYGVVYLLLCDCGSFYVGKTKLKLWSLLQSQRRGLEQASLPEGAEVDPSSQSHHLPRFKWGDEFQAFLRRLHLSRNGKIMCLQTSSSFLLYTMVLVMYHFIYMTSLCMGSWWWYSGVSPLCGRIHGITSLQFIKFCNFILLFIYFSFFFSFGCGRAWQHQAHPAPGLYVCQKLCRLFLCWLSVVGSHSCVPGRLASVPSSYVLLGNTLTSHLSAGVWRVTSSHTHRRFSAVGRGMLRAKGPRDPGFLLLTLTGVGGVKQSPSSI